MKEKVLEIINNIRAAKDMAPVAELHIEDNLRNDLGLTSFDFSTFVSFGLASFIGVSFEASLLIL